MKLSDYVIEFLLANGVDHIFEIIGGAITHLLDSTYKRAGVSCITVHHEQAASFAAEAYARLNGRLGVAMATSGPGALNLLTGIGSCFFDSVPCLFITGQVNTYEYKFDAPVRQVGFQETDIVSVVRPLTKYAELILDPQRIRYHLEKAVYIAQDGRPGPVLLDIPMNIQRAEIEPDDLVSYFATDEFKMDSGTKTVAPEIIERVVDSILQSKRPMILAGGGIRISRATEALEILATKTGIPVVVSLMGLDALPHSHRSYFGLIGAYGNRYSNLALANSDLLLVLGSRLDSRQTGTNPANFARAAKKIQVDIDPWELGRSVKVDIPIESDVGDFLQMLNEALRERVKTDLTNWWETIEHYREEYPSYRLDPQSSKINPNGFMALLSSYCEEGDIICLDVGQNQIWAAQSFLVKKGQRVLISGGMGAMGFALPAAIGAAMVAPRARIIVISGDGGLQINIQELETIANLGIPIKVFVMNNKCLGMVRQFQELYFDGHLQGTVIGYSCPDFKKIADAYGISSQQISDIHGIRNRLRRIFENNDPIVTDVNLSLDTTVSPKMMVGKPIEDMHPFLDRDELKQRMLIDLFPDNDENRSNS